MNAANPNGSLANIAGICNRERNVVGLMPHPERAVESALGSADGLVIFRSMVESLVRIRGNRVIRAYSVASHPRSMQPSDFQFT